MTDRNKKNAGAEKLFSLLTRKRPPAMFGQGTPNLPNSMDAQLSNCRPRFVLRRESMAKGRVTALPFMRTP